MENSILQNRAIYFFLAAIVTLVGGYYLVFINRENLSKTIKKKRIEYIVFILVAFGLLCYSAFYEYHAINPSYKTEQLRLESWITDSKTLASECFFVDADEHDYELSVPFETIKKDLGTKDLKMGTYYNVKYEEYSKVVVDIKQIE